MSWAGTRTRACNVQVTEMTDDERDQLLSAVLDGEATAEDVARVRSDPELTSELDRITDAVGRLGALVVPPPPDVRDRMIAAALDELSPTANVPDATATPVIDLAAQRARRQKRLNILGAAAAIILVVGAAVSLNSGDNRASDTSSVAQEATDGGADDVAEIAPAEITARNDSGEEESAALMAESGADMDAAMEESEGIGGLSQDAIEDAMSGDDEMADAEPPPDAATPEAGRSEEDGATPGEVPVLAPELGRCADQILDELPAGGELRQRLISEQEAVIDYVLGEQLTRLRWNLVDCVIDEELDPTAPPPTSAPDTSSR